MCNPLTLCFLVQVSFLSAWITECKPLEHFCPFKAYKVLSLYFVLYPNDGDNYKEWYENYICLDACLLFWFFLCNQRMWGGFCCNNADVMSYRGIMTIMSLQYNHILTCTYTLFTTTADTFTIAAPSLSVLLQRNHRLAFGFVSLCVLGTTQTVPSSRGRLILWYHCTRALYNWNVGKKKIQQSPSCICVNTSSQE